MKLPTLRAMGRLKLTLALVTAGMCVSSCSASTLQSSPAGSVSPHRPGIPAGCSIFDASFVESATQGSAVLPEPTAVTATWRGTSPTAPCAVTGADMIFARKLLGDLVAAPADFLGSRECPADFGRRIALTFTSSDAEAVVFVSPDGCPDIYLPGKNGSVLTNSVIDDLLTIAPPAFLPALQQELTS